MVAVVGSDCVVVAALRGCHAAGCDRCTARLACVEIAMRKTCLHLSHLG